MYYTSYERSTSTIWRAGMDGSDPVAIVTGLSQCRDVQIDFDTSRLFWSLGNEGRIESSNLEGRDRRRIFQDLGGYPFGLAPARNQIFWGEFHSKKLRSSRMKGDDILTRHTEISGILHLAIVPSSRPSQNRMNPCEGQSCAFVCVLTINSFRCIT